MSATVPSATKVEVCLQAEARSRTRLQQGVAKLKTIPTLQRYSKVQICFRFLRIHHRHTIGQRGFRFVMIEDDDINAVSFSV